VEKTCQLNSRRSKGTLAQTVKGGLEWWVLLGTSKSSHNREKNETPTTWTHKVRAVVCRPLQNEGSTATQLHRKKKGDDGKGSASLKETRMRKNGLEPDQEQKQTGKKKEEESL